MNLLIPAIFEENVGSFKFLRDPLEHDRITPKNIVLYNLEAPEKTLSRLAQILEENDIRPSPNAGLNLMEKQLSTPYISMRFDTASEEKYTYLSVEMVRDWHNRGFTFLLEKIRGTLCSLITSVGITVNNEKELFGVLSHRTEREVLEKSASSSEIIRFSELYVALRIAQTEGNIAECISEDKLYNPMGFSEPQIVIKHKLKKIEAVPLLPSDFAVFNTSVSDSSKSDLSSWQLNLGHISDEYATILALELGYHPSLIDCWELYSHSSGRWVLASMFSAEYEDGFNTPEDTVFLTMIGRAIARANTRLPGQEMTEIPPQNSAVEVAEISNPKRDLSSMKGNHLS